VCGGGAPSGGQGQSPWSKGQGGEEAETLFAYERSTEAPNSPIFLEFENAENHKYLRCFSKKIKFSKLQNVVTD